MPADGEHIDLWKQVKYLLELRTSPVQATWVKGHVSQAQVDQGLFTQQDKDGNDAADHAAVAGAAQHAVPVAVIKSYYDYSQHMKQVALMYVRIACARNHQAKQMKVLTYTRTCASESRPPESNNTPMYLFHTFTGQHCLAKLKKPPSFSGKYRFRFGQLTWEAATWYLSQLRWPKKDDTLGYSRYFFD